MFLCAKKLKFLHSHPKLYVFSNNNFLSSQKQTPTKLPLSLKHITYCLPKSKPVFL